MNDIVIYQPWGGLGDNLGHSPIPEMCHELKIPCYLSNQNAYRNSEIYDLVWSKNPYILGKKDKNDIETWLNNPISRGNTRNWNELKNIQCRYGLPPTIHYPQIYFQPKKILEFADTTIINLSGYSIYTYQNFNSDINLNTYNSCLEKLISKYNLENLINVIDNTDYAIRPKLPILENIKNTYKIKSLEDYANLMYSCKNFICFNSGPSILACAIKNKYKTNSNIFVFNIEKLTPPTNYQCYVFKNATYITIDTQRILEREE